MRYRGAAFLLLIISVATAIGGCGAGGSSQGTSGVTIKIGNGGAAGKAAATSTATSPAIVSIRYSVSGQGMTALTGTVPYSSGGATISLNVPDGPQRYFLIEALDSSGTVDYSGSCYADLNGVPVTLTITLSPAAVSSWTIYASAGAYAYSVSARQTADGGYIGILNGSSLLRLDAGGNSLWQESFPGGVYNGTMYGIQQTADGGYMAAGNLSNGNPLLIKLGTGGNIQWQETLAPGGGYSSSSGFNVVQTSDGGYIGLVDIYPYTGSGSPVPIVLKLSGTGGISWQKAYAGAEIYDIKQTSDGGYVADGDVMNQTYNAAPMILKLDASGNIQWQESLGSGASGQTGSSDYIAALEQTSDGGYIGLMTVSNYSSASYTSEGVIFKLASTGGIQWQKTYSNAGNNLTLAGIRQESGGGYLVPGASGASSMGAASALPVLLKLDSSGNILWQWTEATYRFNSAYLQPTSDGGYLMAGITNAASGSGYLYIISKLDASGSNPCITAGSPGIASAPASMTAGIANVTVYSQPPSSITGSATNLNVVSQGSSFAQGCP